MISAYKARLFRRGIYEWVEEFGLRSYPWRQTEDSFQLFVTEILLRRTRADQVESVWNRFFLKFHSFNEIDSVSDDELKFYLKSLGLVNRRITMLRGLSKNISNQIPNNEVELLSLPGIGKYIARMYLLMRYNQWGLIYDTNFRRVYSRFFDVSILHDLKRDPIIESLSKQIIPKKRTRIFILGVLDFAALTCKPSSPICSNCPLKKSCMYVKNR